MSEGTFRGWVPDEWMDERIPSPQLDPSKFIHGPAGDLWLIGPAGDELDGYDEESGCVERIAPGTIVHFAGLTTWPDISVTVGENRAIIEHDPIPAGATIFITDGDPDTLSYDLPALVEAIEAEAGDTFDVSPYDWSLQADFQLVVDAAGARFVKVDEGSTNA